MGLEEVRACVCVIFKKKEQKTAVGEWIAKFLSCRRRQMQLHNTTELEHQLNFNWGTDTSLVMSCKRLLTWHRVRFELRKFTSDVSVCADQLSQTTSQGLLLFGTWCLGRWAWSS